jgi:hypothetical protein
MFSPSLISMMLQTILGDRRRLSRERGAFDCHNLETDYLAPFLRALIDMKPIPSSPGVIRPELVTGPGPATMEWSRIPVVGRMAPTIKLTYPQDGLTFDQVPEGNGATYLWGRVPVDFLASLLSDFHHSDPEKFYLDLGTPLQVDGSGSTFDTDCHSYLQRSAANPGSARCGAAIIDLGDNSSGNPDDYKGRLRHAVTSGIVMSEHAEKVLSILLARLDNNGLLAQTAVSCALVRPPSQMIGVNKDCFAQANVVEMLDAAKALEPQLGIRADTPQFR